VGKLAVRRCTAADADVLTEIAHGAKRHWGYPEAYIRLWAGDLTLTPEFVVRHPVYAAVDGATILGVYALAPEEAGEGGEFEVEHLWVVPEAMGRGVGRMLFEHACTVARERGARTLRIVSDPNAEGFYLRMGARRTGTHPSTPAGRVLPALRVDVTARKT
jgi:GNAT superfamily N-acetyltransferase